MPHYVEAILAAGYPKYYIKGFRKTVQCLRHYTVVCAVATRPAEVFINKLFEDDRIAAKLPEFEALLRSEVTAVHELPEFIYDRLAPVIGEDVSPDDLRSQCCRAADTCAGYIDRLVFVDARLPPWNLTRGDPDRNLDDLAAGPEPEHPAAKKIRKLTQDGHNRKELKMVIVLLSLIRWSTLQVEQAHGSAAVMYKFHHGYIAETLRLRAFCHMFWKLIRPEKQDTRVTRSGARIDALLAKQSSQIRGFALFTQSLVPAVPYLVPTVTDPQNRTRLLFMVAGKLWKAASMETRQEYNEQAKKARQVAAHSVEDKLEEERANLQEQRQRVDDKISAKSLMGLVQDLRLTDEAKAELQKMFESDKFRGAALETLRQKAAAKAEIPDRHQRKLLGQQPYYRREFQKGPKPWWLSFLCRLRSVLKDAVVQIGGGDDARFYLMLFALQQPHQVTFRSLRSFEVELPFELGWDALVVGVRFFHPFNWALTDDLPYVHEFHLREEAASDVYIVPRVSIAAGVVTADAEPVRLEVFIEQHGCVVPGELHEDEDTDEETSSDEEEEGAPVWLEKHTKDMQQAKKKRKLMRPPGKVKLVDADDSASSDSDGIMTQKVHLDEDGLREYYEKLDEWKAAWDEDHPEPDDDGNNFKTKYRTAPSTFAKKGLVVDFVRATFVDENARKYLVLYKLQQSFDMSVTGHPAFITGALCEAWNHRMQYFYDEWRRAGCDRSYVHSQELIDAYQEPDELLRVVPLLDAKSIVRLNVLRKLTPRAPKT